MDECKIRAAVEELANTPMTISSRDWNRISNVFLEAADEIKKLRERLDLHNGPMSARQ